jgi:hypothetical protein
VWFEYSGNDPFVDEPDKVESSVIATLCPISRPVGCLGLSSMCRSGMVRPVIRYLNRRPVTRRQCQWSSERGSGRLAVVQAVLSVCRPLDHRRPRRCKSWANRGSDCLEGAERCPNPNSW